MCEVKNWEIRIKDYCENFCGAYIETLFGIKVNMNNGRYNKNQSTQ